MKLLILTLALTTTSVFASNIPVKQFKDDKIKEQAIENVENNYIYKKDESEKNELVVKKVDKKSSCMESGYKMITEFDNLMSIKTGETALLLEEIQKSETWLNLQDEEKKLLAKFLIKTNKTENKKTKIKFKKELTEAIIERCQSL
ncbi:MAG: hypothetical protein CL760_00020 [Chloroflexi bacterium]|nr:hypothetical protein [Chloroflexota bacterium]